METHPNVDNPADAEDDSHFSKDGQSKYPFAAHVRELRPRGDVKNAFNGADEAIFDNMRRGIPYGPEATVEELNRNVTTTDRGLLFTCYQIDLSQGFVFVTNGMFLAHDLEN